MESNNFLIYVALGVAGFKLVNYMTTFLLPDRAKLSPQQRWKWRNVATSLVYSLVASVWTSTIIYQVRNEVIIAIVESKGFHPG